MKDILLCLLLCRCGTGLAVPAQNELVSVTEGIVLSTPFVDAASLKIPDLHSFRCSDMKAPQDRTFATLVYGHNKDELLPGLIALLQSMKDTGSKYPIVIMLVQNGEQIVISPDTLQDLMVMCHDVYACTLVKTPHIDIPGKWENVGYWDHVLSKLNAWNMQCNRVAVVDTDMVFLQNPDGVFDEWEKPCSLESHLGCFAWDGENTGLFVLDPSEMHFNNMMISVKHEYAKYDWSMGDNFFLRDYFSHHAGIFHPKFNTRFQDRNMADGNMWANSGRTRMNIKDTIGMHFIFRPKPWEFVHKECMLEDDAVSHTGNITTSKCIQDMSNYFTHVFMEHGPDNAFGSHAPVEKKIQYNITKNFRDSVIGMAVKWVGEYKASRQFQLK